MSSDSPRPAATAAPVTQSERITIIDALRGFAILGILLMNIPGFGLPGGDNPNLLHEYGTIDFKIWHFVDWFPEGTQRAIFSMLFGAGILLFTSRQEKRVEGSKPLEYYTRRQLWLIFFGLVDIYLLLWWGDILFDYGCYGLIMVAFRHWSPKALLMGAAVCFLLMIGRENRDFYQDKKTIHRGELVAAIDTTQMKLTERQKEKLGKMTEFKESNSLEKRIKQRERNIRLTTGSYEDVYEQRTNGYLNYALVHYTYMSIWDVLLFMFVGMAFFKMGILTGEAKTKIYWIMAIAGLGLGLTLSYLRLQPMINYKFNLFDYTKNVAFESYTVSRVIRSIGIFGLLMLLYKSGWLKWLFALLRPVGQMAFTNYLTQSIMCGILFYGIGFGWYGKLERHEVYYVVGVIWIIQIIWSNIWLRYYYFGPLEWLWRSLTYWKRQPLRRI